MNEAMYADSGRTVEEEARVVAAVKASGFDYEDSRLTAEEMERADAGRVRQYERGIITGGELDCLTRHGVMPQNLR